MRSSTLRASTLAHGLIAFLVAALAPGVARAAPLEPLAQVSLGATGPKVSVVVVSLDAKASATQGALEGAAEDALERAARFTVVPARDAFNPAAAKRREGVLDETRAKMKAGKQAIDDLDNVKATEAFSAAVEALKGQSDLSRDFPLLLEAWAMKAAGHATGGENAPAKKDIEAVIGLNAKAEFSPTYFPPDLIKFAEVQRKQAANARGELLVRTEPAGARVWVDGVFRGISPVTVAGLTNVKHHVTATLGGYALAQTQATPGEEVVSLASAELGPGWKKAITDIKKDPEGATRDTAIQALAKAAFLDQVILVVAKKSVAGEKLDLIGLRLEARDQHNLAFKQETVGASDAEALAAFFDALANRDAKRDGRDPVHHFKGGGSNPVKVIAGASLVGLGVVGIVTGITLGSLAAGNEAAFQRTPQTARMPSEILVREGRTYAVVADISWVVGIAAGAAGGVLLVTNALGVGNASEEQPAPPAKKGEKNDDQKRKDADKRAAEERRASEERAKQDQARREEEQKREDDKRKADAKAAEDKKKADEEVAAKKKADEDDASNKKLSKKEREALEKKNREEEARAKKEEEQRKKDEERQRKEDEKRAAEEKKRQEAEEKQNSKLTKKQKEEEERKKKEEESATATKKAEEEARAKKEAEEKKKRDEEERKKKEEEAKKKKDEDHDDLRNY